LAGNFEFLVEMSKTASASTGNSKPKIKNCIEVGAALVFQHGKLLIAQRHAKSHLGGLWEFPGGKREQDETFEQCLARELREELGIEVEVGELFEEIAHAYAEKTVHLKFFICQLISGKPRPLDCAAFKWVAKTELADFEFPAADARLLEKLRAYSFP
jgi:mutator protein MutT